MQLLKVKPTKIHKAKVIQNTKLSDDIYRLELVADLEEVNPGNFISILCEGKTLRRPFSIAGFKYNKLEILYKVKGDGTIYMSELRPNDKVDFIGALGNSFSINNHKSLLIGAGVGVAPIKFLSEKLSEKGIDNKIIAGLQTNITDLLPKNSTLYTNDGSSGLKGSVLDNLEQEIIEYNPKIIYTCGPKIVMETAVKLAKKYNLQIETALERDFACGVGACMGCIVEIIEEDGLVNKRICKDGPVFDGRKVIWN
ncbi:MAG: dihydroorotate dehydrogenase electron transfer subunit [bacterium]